MYEIRKLYDEELVDAIDMCFEILVRYTAFRKYAKYKDKAKKHYISLVLKEHNINNSVFYGLFMEDEIIGVIQYVDNYIMQFVVKDEYQKMGYGSLLLNNSIKSEKDIIVDAAIEAIGFYEKNGFIKLNEVKKDKHCVKMKKIND